MRHRSQAIIGIAFGLFGGGGAQFASAAAVINTQIGFGAPEMPNRLVRDSSASVCGTAKAFPGTYAGGPYAYQSLGVVKSNADGCVNFLMTITGTCGTGSGVFLSGYNAVFNPADLSLGYLGDSGSSAQTNAAASMGLTLSANQSIGLMVNIADAGSSGPCEVTVSTPDDVTPRIFTVFVGQLSANLPAVAPRLNRNGIVSACGSAKPFPGTYGGGPYPYLSFVGMSPVATCARATVSVAGTGCGAEDVHLTGYDPFSAANIASGYLGDTGSSAAMGGPRSMDIDVGANQPITLVANQVDTTATSNCTVAVAAFGLLNDRIFADGVE